MPLKEIRGIFPNTKGTRLEITSDIDINYNCAAWAIEENNRWWEPWELLLPDPPPELHWPDGLLHNSKVETYVRFFELKGYEIADDDILEQGYTKIALYEEGGEFRHVARQLTAKKWSSKLGPKEDISHELRALENDGKYAYGTASIFMKKPR